MSIHSLIQLMATATNVTDVLDREFPELRAGLLQVAAGLDRIERAAGGAADDARMQAAQKAIEILHRHEPNRAEQIQLIFSRTFDANWKKQFEIGRSSSKS
jgi:hypothetical protein